jgi:hypothetical protein
MVRSRDTGEFGASIKIHTKAGNLDVARGCNCTYRNGVSESSVMFGFSLDHRSEDIEAHADIALSPHEARTVANRLLELANKVEGSQGTNETY